MAHILKAETWRGKTAIVGVGTTRQGEHPGRSAEQIGVEALGLALADSGIDKSEIDGLITCATTQGQGTDASFGPLLGIDPAFSATLDYGSCNFSLHLAVMAIASGLASTVALIYGCNQRTNKASFAGGYGAGADFTHPYGYLHVAAPFAMAFNRHRHLYGTTEEQLGHVAVVQREYARMNPLSVFTDPLTIDDYLATPYLIEPLRRHDMTMISDGGAALIVTSAERARDLPGKAVSVAGMAEQAAWRSNDLEDNVMRPWMKNVAARLYGSSGFTPDQIDLLYVQDPCSFYILEMLEHYGFCQPGESGPFVAAGNTRLGGRLPVNTNGGQLSEAYMWGWLHLCEAVRQLRGECGARQVLGARVAQYASAAAGLRGAATILTVED
ncbi:thiolase family protein [Novosphingobium bradum]|uniref:Thiolase family protein n=1 Tax=Novosphingobium bradum TaxID=1737444 RepID=A0ABV7ILY1_9SPHN